MQGAAQRHGAADLAAGRRDLVPGSLDCGDEPLGGHLQRGPLLGQRYAAAGAVEQRCPQILLQAGDSARHRGLTRYDTAGGRGEAPGIATGEEILKVTDFHGTIYVARSGRNHEFASLPPARTLIGK